MSFQVSIFKSLNSNEFVHFVTEFHFTNLKSMIPSLFPAEAGSASSVYVTGQGPYYHGTSQPHGSSSQPTAYLPPSASTHTNPPAPPTQPQPPPSAREDKRLQSVYLSSSRGTLIVFCMYEILSCYG